MTTLRDHVMASRTTHRLVSQVLELADCVDVVDAINDLELVIQILDEELQQDAKER